MNPLISIIVPVYNVEQYLHHAVDSLINQTYSNIEIILIDDGSLDQCPRICDDYAYKDSRVRVHHKKNGGLSDARNVGLNMAKGEFITFLDSDDYLSADAIERFVKIVLQHDVEVVCCGLNIVDHNGRIYDFRKNDFSFKTDAKTVVKYLIQDVFPYNFAPAKLYKRDLFNGIRFPVGRIYEDMATIYIVISNAKSVYCMKECLYYYERGREGSITSELNSPKAAWSYYCGCINCKEQILFCMQHPKYNDLLPTIMKHMYVWSKLCIETAIAINKDEYKSYCSKIKYIQNDIPVSLPFKMKIIFQFCNIYYYLYPILKQIKC